MFRFKNRFIFALMIPVLLVNLTLTALFGPADALDEQGYAAPKLSIFNVCALDDPPACPDEDGQDSEQGHSCSQQHSLMCLAHLSPSISYQPYIIAYLVTEPFKPFPEVYLERFIPPEIPA